MLLSEIQDQETRTAVHDAMSRIWAAKVQQKQAQDIIDEANDECITLFSVLGEKKVEDGVIGAVTVAANTPRAVLDKKEFKLQLATRGVPAAIIADAEKDSTKMSEVKSEYSVRFTPPKD